jgi:aliphatic nitrilase
VGDRFPVFKAAVVQASSILYDRERCLKKAVALIEEVAKEGAELVAFPESFIPGYPYHVWLGSPMWYHEQFKEWFFNSVEIPSTTVKVLCEAAAKHNINVVMGVTERDGNTCYNTLLFIDRRGRLLGKHRKLMPTHVERTHWGYGDGSDLRTFELDLCRISGLICWEHTMDLARHAIIAQRPKVHVASWVGFSNVAGWETLFNMSTELCSRYHAHVGECYVLNVQGTADEQNVEKLCQTDYQRQFFKKGGGWSAIIAPGGGIISGPLMGEEGILYAEIDLNTIADMAHWHDATGHYSRPDVVSLLVHNDPYRVTWYVDRVIKEIPRITTAPVADTMSVQRLLASLEQLDDSLRRAKIGPDIEKLVTEVKREIEQMVGSAT